MNDDEIGNVFLCLINGGDVFNEKKWAAENAVLKEIANIYSMLYKQRLAIHLNESGDESVSQLIIFEKESMGKYPWLKLWMLDKLHNRIQVDSK
jgi:hypothetical protein